MTERIIGIDLGTTNSLAATVFDQVGPEVIAESGQTPIIPSVLTMREGEWLVAVSYTHLTLPTKRIV